jgi:hypothetical protein
MKVSILTLILASVATFTYSPNVNAHRYDIDDRIVCAKAILAGQPKSEKCKDVDRDNCGPSDYRDYGIEALCLFAEDSALAGHWPANPIAGDLVDNYAKAHIVGSDLKLETDNKAEYFGPKLHQIHDCYTSHPSRLSDY